MCDISKIKGGFYRVSKDENSNLPKGENFSIEDTINKKGFVENKRPVQLEDGKFVARWGLLCDNKTMHVKLDKLSEDDTS